MNEKEAGTKLATTSGGVVGRFAPSPTGDLHMGSLMAAVASFLQARTAGGRWLLRIEDLDPPREVTGAADRILFDLERFGFEWDGSVWYQSQRHSRYRDALDALIRSGQVYPCGCSRRDIQSAGLHGVDGYRYNGHCRNGLPVGCAPRAWRVKMPDQSVLFVDGIQGTQCQNLAREVGDFVLLRADGCWAYQLAVIVDDAEQGVNQIVRGADLLDSTPRQIYLQRLLKYAEPEYFHISVITNAAGEKLSKQTKAPVLAMGSEVKQLWQALYLLHQTPPDYLRGVELSEIWAWAVSSWSVRCMPQKKAISVSIDETFEYRFLELNK